MSFQKYLMSVALVGTSIVLSACGERPVDRALTGGAIGAASGAVVGSTVGNPIAGAIIGGAGGAVIGAVTSPNRDD